ncbi:hypothetical protein ACFO6X_04645 [Giesbergeria sinuosa]|uniref:Uncharacterized protein n=1 Tax=Giesbergeria sinuosa TaxID=80883 RepID=A0ABV9QC98_9BURK
MIANFKDGFSLLGLSAILWGEFFSTIDRRIMKFSARNKAIFTAATAMILASTWTGENRPSKTW